MPREAPNLHDVVSVPGYSTTGYRIQSSIAIYPCYSCAWLASDSLSLILLSCYCTLGPPDGIPAGYCILVLRLVVCRHSIMETKRSALCRVPQLASWTLQLSMAINFSLGVTIERVAAHRWPLKWSGRVNRRFLQALSALSWWPPRLHVPPLFWCRVPVSQIGAPCV